MLAPAFVDVGTASFLTNRVQVESFNEAPHGVELVRSPKPDPQPGGAGLAWVADLDEGLHGLILARIAFCFGFGCGGREREGSGRLGLLFIWGTGGVARPSRKLV